MTKPMMFNHTMLSADSNNKLNKLSLHEKRNVTNSNYIYLFPCDIGCCLKANVWSSGNWFRGDVALIRMP